MRTIVPSTEYTEADWELTSGYHSDNVATDCAECHTQLLDDCREVELAIGYAEFPDEVHHSSECSFGQKVGRAESRDLVHLGQPSRQQGAGARLR